MLHFYGIELKTDPFLTITYLAFVSLKLVFEAFILFSVLRLMRVNNLTQGLVFICFSVVVTYAPLFSWIDVPQAMHLDDVLIFLKSLHLSVTDTVWYFFQHASEINEHLKQPVPGLLPYADMASNAIYLLSAMLVAECLSQMLNIEKPRAYLATAIALTLNLIPAMLVGLLQAAVTFSLLSVTQVQNPG